MKSKVQLEPSLRLAVVFDGMFVRDFNGVNEEGVQAVAGNIDADFRAFLKKHRLAKAKKKKEE